MFYYQDVKCREEMYDKDIILLQVSIFEFLGSSSTIVYNLYYSLILFYVNVSDRLGQHTWSQTVSSCWYSNGMSCLRPLRRLCLLKIR